jgi:hypothetical protein
MTDEEERRDEERSDEERRDEEEAQRRFREDLEVREEVAPAGTEELPPGATHEIDDEDGEPHRRRYSAT